MATRVRVNAPSPPSTAGWGSVLPPAPESLGFSLTDIHVRTVSGIFPVCLICAH